MAQKQPIIALLPAFNYYEKIIVKADIFALRLSCQIDNKIRDYYNFVFFDGFIDKYLGQKHNEKAVFEALKHSTGEKGDCSEYKGLSLVDINHAGIYCSAFLHCYREALAFLSLLNQFGPSKVIIASDDPNRDIFDELAKQIRIGIDIVQSFGSVNNDKTELIKNSNRGLDIQKFDWHRLENYPVWKQAITSVFNLWSKLVRKIRGNKHYIYIDHLSGLRKQLSVQLKYYPFFLKLIKLPVMKLFLSGAVIFKKKDITDNDNSVSAAIRKYEEYLKTIKDKKTIGQVEFCNKEYSVAGSIIQRLQKDVGKVFNQFADSIDIYENFISKNIVKGAFLSSDMNWENRMIVRIFQKHNIENMALMNGWFGTKHMLENKTVNKVICFGDSYISNYFKDKKNIKIMGSFIFDTACKKRNLIKPQYPIRKILLSTFTFSPADINCRYSDSEKYLNDILAVIKKYANKNNYRMQIAIRPHPSDSPDFYRWYLERLGFSEIEIKATGSFQEVVSGYDLFFASYSTTLFETAVMGIPVIFYHPCNQILYPPFDGTSKELPAAFTSKDLEGVFNKIMDDKDYAYKFTDVEVLRPYVGEIDGNSTSRIINEVIRMAEGN